MRLRTAVPMVCGLALGLTSIGDFHFGSTSGCTCQFMRPLFLYFFKSFRSLGLGSSYGSPNGFFTKLIPPYCLA